MTSKTFSTGTVIDSAWLNDVNTSVYVTVPGISTVPNVSNATGTLTVSHGGTGATTASAARTALGSTTVGDAVFVAASQAAAQTAIGYVAPPSPSSTTPLASSGSGAVGSGTTYARADHVHPAATGITYFTTPSTLSVSAVQTIAHGLGVVPTSISTKLLVTTASNNWAVGSIIDGLGISVGGVANHTISVGADATNITIATGSSTVIGLIDKTGGFASSPVGNFKVIIGVS